MKKLSLALGALAIAMLPASSALADTFDFNFSGALFSGTGTFTANFNSGDQWTITGVTGSVSSGLVTSNIDSLLAPGTYPTGFLQSPNDNILIYPSLSGLFGDPIYFDHNGVSFSLADGNNVNLNDTIGLEWAVATQSNITELDSISVSAAPTPEPSSLFLFGTGILGVAGVIRRKMASTIA